MDFLTRRICGRVIGAYVQAIRGQRHRCMFSSMVFETAVEHGNLPFEEVDEDGFAGREHGAQDMIGHRTERFFDDVQHGAGLP